jgi:putrescine importer
MTSTEITPRLTPKIGLAGLVFFGVSYMSVTIALLTFGILADTSNNTTAIAFLIATVAMLLTALSYGVLAKQYPTSGSVYSYARELLGGHVGFLSGWALMLDYVFLPMVANFVSALYLNAQFPAVPIWGWLVIIGVVLSTINSVGLKATDWVNKLFVIGAGTVVLIVLGYFISTMVDAPPTNYVAPLWNSASTIPAVTAAAAIAAYSFLGFDAVSTLSEEAKDASKNVPRALWLAVLIGGAIFFIIAYVVQLAVPHVDPATADTAWYAALTPIAGERVTNILNLLIVILGSSSALSVQAGSSRLLFVMGRDGVLPRRFFGYLNRRFETPVFNIVLLAVLTLIAVRLDLAQATSLINFGAFMAFTVVNVCAMVFFFRQRHTGTLGMVRGLVLPALGALVDVYLLLQLDNLAKILGVSWLVIGVVYLAVLTRGFRRQPPQLSLDDDRPASSSATADASTPHAGDAAPVSSSHHR